MLVSKFDFQAHVVLEETDICKITYLVYSIMMRFIKSERGIIHNQLTREIPALP
jgi:hypothetical protein